MAKANTGTTVKKVLLRIKRYWFFLILSILMAAVTVASSLYVPILIGNAIDYIIGPQNVEFKAITAILSEVGIVIAITALSQWIMNICNNKITYHVTRDIRDEAIEKIEVLPLKYIDGHSYGEVVSRVIADVDQFADGLLMGFTQFFSGVLTILGTLGFMLSINVKITLVVIVITPLSLFVASFIAKHTYQMLADRRLYRHTAMKMRRLKDLMKLMTVCRNVHSKPFFIHRLPIRLPVLSTALYMRGLR